MILDNEEQRAFLLELMEQVNYPGRVLDLAHSVKAAIQSATVPDAESSAEGRPPVTANKIVAGRREL